MHNWSVQISPAASVAITRSKIVCKDNIRNSFPFKKAYAVIYAYSENSVKLFHCFSFLLAFCCKFKVLVQCDTQVVNESLGETVFHATAITQSLQLPNYCHATAITQSLRTGSPCARMR